MGRLSVATLLAGIALGISGLAQVRDSGRPAIAGTASISGRVEVVAGDARAPLRRATVQLVRQGVQVPLSAATDQDGRFTFERLPGGTYRIDVLKSGFVRAAPPETTIVAEAQHVTTTLDMTRAAALAGRVLDDRGVPIERLRVTATAVTSTGATASRSALTDDLGRFRVHSLPPGGYRLHIEPPPPSAVDRLHFPGVADVDEAVTLEVASGQTIEGLEMIVPTTPPAMVAEGLAAAAREVASAPETPEWSGRIDGRVTRSDVGTPIPNAQVRLVTTTGLTLRTVVSDGDGRFAFARLRHGPMVLRASAPGFLAQDASTSPTESGTYGRQVTLTEANPAVRADLNLVPACAIEVRALDEFGDPAPGVAIRVLPRRQSLTPPRPEAPLPTTGVTDDRGWLRAHRLPPGDYTVVSVANPLARVGSSAFATTYYPGTTSPELAGQIHVAAGADAFDVSFGLVAAKTVTISGVVEDPAGRRLPALAISLRQRAVDNSGVMTTSSDGEGRFTFRDLPEGTYALIGSGGSQFGSMPLVVAAGASADEAPARLVVRRSTTARGRIVFDGSDSPRPPGPWPMLSLRFTDPALIFAAAAAGNMATFAPADVYDTATFEIRELVAPGVIEVSADRGSPWILARVLLQGRDITDRPYDFHLDDVDGLEVVLTRRTGAIAGAAREGSDAVVGAGAGASVLVFGAESESPHYMSRTAREGRADEQGQFQIARLLPGRYFVIARRTGGMLTPDRLLDLRRYATLVTVEENGTTRITLREIR